MVFVYLCTFKIVIALSFVVKVCNKIHSTNANNVSSIHD